MPATMITESSRVPALLYSFRRAALTPSRRQVDLVHRGFTPPSPAARPALEMAGHAFLDGFSIIMGTASTSDHHRELAALPHNALGFAYEGAGMAAALLDGLPAGHSHHLSDLLSGDGLAHEYMIYVGAGWALARLPRARWAAATGALKDPVLAWLALDGYGFHQAYFKTNRYVRETRMSTGFPWPTWDFTSYAQHAIDQGIGRALWFVGGASSSKLLALVSSFDQKRHSDLFAGLGLAATYAGGSTVEDLEELVRGSGEQRASLFQGCVFAAEARRRAGNITTWTETAANILAGGSVEDVANLAVSTRPNARFVEGEPSYEHWRREIMALA